MAGDVKGAGGVDAGDGAGESVLPVGLRWADGRETRERESGEHE